MNKSQIAESDYWWIGVIYSTLVAFADNPDNTINRIGGGKISVPEDQIADLREYSNLLMEKYPELKSTELFRVIKDIELLLTPQVPEVPREFWTNSGFCTNPKWGEIRNLCRNFLLR